MRNQANEWITEVIRLADLNGWIVIAYDVTAPGSSVTLRDSRATEITIRDDYGLSIKDYVDRLAAIDSGTPALQNA